MLTENAPRLGPYFEFCSSCVAEFDTPVVDGGDRARFDIYIIQKSTVI